MDIELKFEKTNESNWGFRLTGGAEFNQPLTVIKVTPDSLAEKFGLHTGDAVIKINGVSTVSLTHAKAHDLINKVGNHLIITIRREALSHMCQDQTEDYKQNCDEVTRILESAVIYDGITQPNQSVIVEVERSASNHENQIQQEFSSCVTQEIGQTTIAQSNVSDVIQLESAAAAAETQRKWSTFLQKPRNPPPKPKKVNSIESKIEPYRVIIKKQKTKSDQLAEMEEEKNQQIQRSLAIAEAITSHQTKELEIEENTELIHQEESMQSQQQTEIEVSVRIEEETEIYSEEATEEEIQAAAQEVSFQPTSLEEQLAQVQKQLQELAQLPSTIQITLDSVTQQLAKIVTAARDEINEETRVYAVTKTECDDSTESHEEQEEIVNAEEDCDTISEICISNDEKEEEVELENKEAIDVEHQHIGNTEENTAPTEEDEVKLIQEKKRQKGLEHQQRRLEQRPTFPLTPLERPIILPGGRKWVQPDDACPRIRNPKMTDEKIANTIEIYSEVFAGHLKGINFLKYQPPPKNLDYLQKSEVYRLVHDMEPPMKGIARRASRILAAEDYKGEVIQE